VARDVPAYSHFQFDLLAPMSLQLGIWRNATGDEGRENAWYWNGAWTYLLLSDPGAAPALEAKLGAFIEKYFPDSYKTGAALPLQPLPSIHLHSHLGNEVEANGNVAFVYSFSAIALLVLVIACINFGNLTAVQVMQRAREVGVRRALGAGRAQVNVQILSEGMLLSVLALALAAVLAVLFLPVFSTLTGTRLAFDGLGGWAGGSLLLLLVCTVGLVPGLYPALRLSKLPPLATLRGDIVQGRRRWTFRNLLVVLQFATSMVLMIGVGVIYQQVRYTQERGLGFEKAHVVVAEARPEIHRQYDAFREALLANPAIREVASTAYVPGQGADGYRFIPEGRSADEPLMIPLTAVNYEFADVMGLSMQEGRWFSRAFPSDAEEGFVINQQALELLGWTDQPLGRQLQLLAPGTTEIWQTGRVIGVIRDYHFESLHNPLKPLVMAYVPSAAHLALKVDGQRAQEALAHLEQTWAQFSPEWPPNPYFLDQDLEALYNREQRLGEVTGYFTLLAVLIACLGLVGLGSFTAARRRKEICIRKVHGATVPRVVALLSQGYLQLLAASFIVAAPLAYYGMSRWLDNFAYHTAIRPGVFVAAGLAAVLMAGLSVGYQSVRAALSDPAAVLRHE
jgi:putative ABC transport system permease protein